MATSMNKQCKLIILFLAMLISGFLKAQVPVVIWTNQNLHGTIDVYYNDSYVGRITKYYSSAPGPNAAGCVTITVSGSGNTFYGVAQDGTRWNSKAMTLQGSYYTICLVSNSKTTSKTSSSSSGSSSSSSSSSSSGSYSSSDYSDAGAQAMAALGLAVLGVGLYIAGARSEWDEYTNRLDLGVGAGMKYGPAYYGASLTYRLPRLFGITAGMGYDFSNHGVEGYKKMGGYVGGQIWMFNGWNLEGGVTHNVMDHDFGWYAMTNTEFGIFDHLGFYGGLGYGRSGGEGYPMVDIGLIIRLMAK